MSLITVELTFPIDIFDEKCFYRSFTRQQSLLYTRYPIVARALGLAAARAKVYCIQQSLKIDVDYVYYNPRQTLPLWTNH